MDQRFTAKELAALLGKHVTYIYAMERQGFRMIARTATLAEAKEWLRRNPLPRRRAKPRGYANPANS